MYVKVAFSEMDPLLKQQKFQIDFNFSNMQKYGISDKSTSFHQIYGIVEKITISRITFTDTLPENTIIT